MPVALVAQTATATKATHRRAGADSVPSDGWVDIYFLSFDPAARAAGLVPLRELRLRPGEREVRIWTQVEIAVPKQLYRLVDRRGAVDGEMIYYWGDGELDSPGEGRAGETMHDLMRYSLRGRCDRFAVAEKTGVCRARFRHEPPWSAVLRAAEAESLWTNPDPSALPPDDVMVFDGWTIVVELRDGAHYRTYRYNSPEAHPRWPSTARVQAIARGLVAIDSLVAPASVRRTYRGVTTGAWESAFEVCGDTATWQFQGELRHLASIAPADVRRTLPPSLSDTTLHDGAGRAPAELFTVEVDGELAPEWLSRRWESRFSRVLDVYVLRAAHLGVATDCRRGARERAPGGTGGG